MSTYVKTVWVSGGAPGIDKTELDNIEDGIFDAHDELANHVAGTADKHALDGHFSDVVITTVTDDEVLAYDTGTSKWINQTAAEAGLALASALHAEAHAVASHSDTTGTGAELETLTDGSDADALHAHNLKAALASPTFTGNVIMPVGTELLPGLTYPSDPNTGIRWVSADKFALVAAGTDRLTIAPGGVYVELNADSFLVEDVVNPGDWLFQVHKDVWSVGYPGWGGWAITQAVQDGGAASSGARWGLRGAVGTTDYHDWHFMVAGHTYLLLSQDNDAGLGLENQLQINRVANTFDIFGNALVMGSETLTEAMVSDYGTKVLDFVLGGTAAVGAIPFLFRAPFAFTIVGSLLTSDTAPVGGTPAMKGDLHKNAVTVYTGGANRPEIASGANSGAATVPAVTAVAKDDILTGELDIVGSTTPGANVVLEVHITVP